jgi:hypothetical protein
MELLNAQGKYFMLIMKNLFLTYLREYENIALYSKEELEDMLQTLENAVNELEQESNLYGEAKYDMKDSLPFIQESIGRVMQKYNFKGWVIG